MKKKIVPIIVSGVLIFGGIGSAITVDAQDIIKTKQDRINYEYNKNKNMKNFSNNNVIVKLKDKSNIEGLKKILDKHSYKFEETLTEEYISVKVYNIEKAMKNLSAYSFVEYVEPDYDIDLIDYKVDIDKNSNSPKYIPDEPRFSELWGLKNDEHPGIDINVESAWDVTKGNEDIVVAVLDTGIDTNHEELKDNLWINKGEIPGNGIDDDGNGFVDDVHGYSTIYDTGDISDKYGHGSHVSVTIAALENKKGIIGVAPNVKIMPVKILGDDGKGKSSTTIKGVNYAIKNNAKILNASFGSVTYNQSFKDMIEESDCILVASSGNDAIDTNNKPYYPASYDCDNIISVASIDKMGNMAKSSNYGTYFIDIAAPGQGILSTLPNNKYGSANGTSMAAPHVTGVVALVKSAYPELKPLQVVEIILKSTKQLDSLKGKIKTEGIVDAKKAIEIGKNYDPNHEIERPDNNIEEINDIDFNISSKLDNNKNLDAIGEYNQVLINDKNESKEQIFRFKFIKEKNSYQIINSKYPDKVLSLAGRSEGENCAYLLDNYDLDAQYWIVDKTSDGYFVIRNKYNPTLALSLDNESTENGNSVMNVTFNGKDRVCKIKCVFS